MNVYRRLKSFYSIETVLCTCMPGWLKCKHTTSTTWTRTPRDCWQSNTNVLLIIDFCVSCWTWNYCLPHETSLFQCKQAKHSSTTLSEPWDDSTRQWTNSLQGHLQYTTVTPSARNNRPWFANIIWLRYDCGPIPVLVKNQFDPVKIIISITSYNLFSVIWPWPWLDIDCYNSWHIAEKNTNWGLGALFDFGILGSGYA